MKNYTDFQLLFLKTSCIVIICVALVQLIKTSIIIYAEFMYVNPIDYMTAPYISFLTLSIQIFSLIAVMRFKKWGAYLFLAACSVHFYSFGLVIYQDILSGFEGSIKFKIKQYFSLFILLFWQPILVIFMLRLTWKRFQEESDNKSVESD